MMHNYLKQTRLLDYSDPIIEQLVITKNWKSLKKIDCIKAIYTFVRDEIKFGYNRADDIQATEVLRDGYGQCNTKAILLMTLLRAHGIPNRIHGFTINKALQKGVINGIWYKLSPKNILHSWVEVYVNNKWYCLEGVILDKEYLTKLQESNRMCNAAFCGYGVCTDNFDRPVIDWNLNHTFIQDKGINHDFGIFDTPDDFYDTHQQQLSRVKRFVFRKFVRHVMNNNVQSIRNSM